MNRQAQPGTAAISATAEAPRVPRAIEVGFPIVEINRLAEPERNSFKPIYQMHKWFARRASCVFRAILLGALKPAVQPDGTPTDLMAEFYRDHSQDPDTKGHLVLDPFMGGGTTVVEALRLGCRVVGIDLNPVAWFIVKTEVEPVDLNTLNKAYERLTTRPVAWNGGKPLRDTLLDLYKTEVAPGVEADVIYTFWVKHAICTDPNCKREIPLFKDWFIARRTVKVRHYRDALCPACKKSFSWELENASLIADPVLMAVSRQDRSGAWAYAAPPEDKKGSALVSVGCPHCRKSVQLQKPKRKAERKPADLAVLLCPECETLWQWRGPLPEGKVQCPACKHSYDPNVGNVPDKGSFQCRCGNRDKIITSIRQLPQDRRLTVRPYAMQASLPPPEAEEPEAPQAGLFDTTSLYPLSLSSRTTKGGSAEALKGRLLLPGNGKFFTRFSPSDQARLQKADALWEKHKNNLPYPKSAIPVGYNTNQMLKHNYRYWHDMFAPRQLLALSTLLDGIMAEPDEKLREMLLCAFSATLNNSNMFSRYHGFSYREGKIEGVFARHEFQPKVTICESNVFGVQHGYGAFLQNFEKLLLGKADAVASQDEEGLLQSLCDTGFELAAVYPVHGEAESSLHLMDKENISYDLIHVCRKRVSNPEPRSWAGVRQEVRRRARAELPAIEAGRYGGQPLAEPDVRLICIGKCLELYSAHYDKVLDHEGKTLPLHQALQDIASIVDQLVTRERPLPPELEAIDALSYAWLRLLASRHTEVSVDKLSYWQRVLHGRV